MSYLVHQLLVESARSAPEHPAVVDGNRSVTYRQLDEGSNRIARLLLALGVGRGDRVGLYLNKSPEAVAGIYGVLKAGAAYVPLDPQAPVMRVGYIVRNCGMNCVLSDTAHAPQWRALHEAAPDLLSLITLDAPAPPADAVPTMVRGVGTAEVDLMPGADPSVGMIDLDLAYILYTSGSTGEPKGVKLSHLNALSFVNWARDEFGVGAEDRLSSHAPLHFDLSTFDLFAAALGGATVVLVPPQVSMFPVELAQFMADNAITVWYSVPSVLAMLALRGGLKPGALPRLRTVLFAGEVFPTPQLRQLMAHLPNTRFCNLYGPTETNVCTWYDVPQIPDEQIAPVSIGRAITNVEVFPLTERGTRAHPGEVGELYVRGNTVMQGYWGDQVRTDVMLVSNPLQPELRDPVYKTGDLVREDPDGNLIFLGRRDNQIKSRGYRIELGDIEAALYAHPAVVECAAVPVPDPLVSNRIKAFVVTRNPVEPDELRQFCADRVPVYMVPDSWEMRSGLPKTSTGKIDRKSLQSEARTTAPSLPSES